MIFNEYYKNYSILQYKTKNIPEVKKAAKRLLDTSDSKNDKWLLTKVINHIKRTGIEYTSDDVLKQITQNDLIASQFCKSAAKQNSSEKCQLDYIKEYKNINLENLSAGGTNTWRFVSNTGEFKQTPKVEGKTSHSFDFRYRGKYDYFIMAKVTTTQGGGQNQQRQEMLDIIDDMKMFYVKNPDSNIRFVLLLDGDSYDGEGMTPFIKKAKSENRIFITNSDTFYAE